MRYQTIDKSLFIDNRARFSKKMKPNSIAVFHSADLMPRTADQSHIFKQNPDLFYLSGLDQEEILLVLFPDSPIPKYREALFIKKTSEQIAIWEGQKYTKAAAEETSGIANVYWYDSFQDVISMLMHHAENLYINLNENDRANNNVPYWDLRFGNEMRSRFPGHNFERSGPIMASLRTIKSDMEVNMIQHACDITKSAFARVLGFVEPGKKEYEIEAEIIHEFLINGSSGHAYEPIVASGRNSCVLHYVNNDMVCQDGDVLLMDFGADYGNYAADLSRTIPVNGRFTERQKAVYNAVLRVMKEATQMLVPGTLLEEYHKEVGKIMESELIGLGLLDKSAVAKQNPDKPLYKKYFMHGTSHFLGLDVHDIGNRYEPMKAGMVFTCEPGIYILEENLGIRIENDLLITDNGPKDLMGSIPIEVEEIEELMNAKVVAG